MIALYFLCVIPKYINVSSGLMFDVFYNNSKLYTIINTVRHYKYTKQYNYSKEQIGTRI